MRGQFEKLPEIAKNIDKYVFCEMENKYKELNIRYALGRIKINGAWYAFQEQQNQLDLINQYTAAQGASIKILNDERIKQQKKIDAVLQYMDTGDHPLDFSANTIRELLK